MRAAIIWVTVLILSSCGGQHKQVREEISANELFYDSKDHAFALHLDDGSGAVMIFKLQTPNDNLEKISKYLDAHSAKITGAVFRLSRFDEFYEKSEPQARKSTWANFVFDRPIAAGDHNISFGYNFVYDSLHRIPFEVFDRERRKDFDYQLTIPIDGHTIDHRVRSSGEHQSGP